MALVVGTDSYVDLTYFNSYLSSRYNSDDIEALSDPIKETILKSATRAVDVYCVFAGNKTDYEQTLEFPRNGDTEVDEKIKISQCEIAVSIYESESVVSENEPNLKEMKVDVITFKFGDISKTNTLYNDYVSRLMRGFCSAYSGVGAKKLTRV